MAMNPKDIQLRDGKRQPVNRVESRGRSEWASSHRQFAHKRLHDALANLIGPKGAKS